MAHRLGEGHEVLAVEEAGALAAVEPEHEAHRGRLARAVGAEEAGHGARAYVEGQVGDRGLSLVLLAEPAGLDRCHRSISFGRSIMSLDRKSTRRNSSH